MTDRIASFTTSRYSTQQSMRLQSEYASTIKQQTSGLKSTTFSGIATQAQPLLNLTTQYHRITTQMATTQSAINTLTVMQDATQGITDLISRMTGQVNTAIGTTTLNAETISGWRDELAALLNTRHNGQYVFGGTATDTAPIDLTASPYYQGDTTLPSVRASDQLTVTYGVTAGAGAFNDLFAALDSMIANPNDTTTLQAAYTQLTSAYDRVADMQGTLGASGATLEQQSTLQATTLEHLDNQIADINAVDLAATALKLSEIETQLEASYSSLAKLMNLKLTDYLR